MNCGVWHAVWETVWRDASAPGTEWVPGSEPAAKVLIDAPRQGEPPDIPPPLAMHEHRGATSS